MYFVFNIVLYSELMEVLHIFGICPDSLSHFDILDVIMTNPNINDLLTTIKTAYLLIFKK